MEREKRWRLSVMFYFTQSCSILSVFNHKHFLITNTRSSKEHWVKIISYVAFLFFISLFTGKYLSEALILASTNPQYDDRLFIELRVQYMKIPSSEHVVFINCSECQSKNKNKKQFMNTTCSELVIFMYWTRNSMDNILSYCGLVDARISTSEKDLPVQCTIIFQKCK